MDSGLSNKYESKSKYDIIKKFTLMLRCYAAVVVFSGKVSYHRSSLR